MIPDEELLEYYKSLLQDADLLVYGRKTYQLMVPYWPDIAKSHSETKAENEYADVFESVSRLVFSRSLKSSGDQKTKIVHTNPKDEISLILILLPLFGDGLFGLY